MDKRTFFRATPLDLPLLFFLSSAFIGLWASYDPSLSWPLLVTLVGSLALYKVVTWLGINATVLRPLAWLLIMVQVSLGLYLITQYSHLGYPTKISLIDRFGRLTGDLLPAIGHFRPHPNAVATFIEGGLPLAAGLWLSTRSRWGRLLTGLSLVVLSYGLLLTASRGAWVAVAGCTGLALSVWIGRHLPRRWQVVGLLFLITLAGAVGIGITLIDADRAPILASTLSRGTDRVELYENSLHLIRDYPLSGIGLGDTFGRIYSEYILLIPYVYLTYAHNLPLSIWLNQGIIGLVSFGWMLTVFYRLTISQTSRTGGAPLFGGAVAGVTIMLLHGLTDAPQYADSRWIMPVFFALLGLSIAAAPPSPRTTQRLSPSSKRVLLLALLIATSGAVAIFLLRDIFYANLGAIQQTRADLSPSLDDAARQKGLDQATRYYQRALEFDGQQPVAHWRLGLVALNTDRFSEAIEHLEPAYSAMPGHRGTQKALGYAYLWDGQVERAEALLRPLSEVSQELDTWVWWRGTQGQEKLADYARRLQSRLGQNP